MLVETFMLICILVKLGTRLNRIILLINDAMTLPLKLNYM
jgi:hypothetical protein